MGQTACKCPEPEKSLAKPNYQDLWDAATTGDLGYIQRALKILPEAQINGSNHKGDTLLSTAATYGHAEIISELLQRYNLHLNSYHDFQGSQCTPLWIAAANGHTECVKTLLHSNLSCRLDRVGCKERVQSAVMVAAERHHWECVSHFIVVYENLDSEEAMYIVPIAIKEKQWNIAFALLSNCTELDGDIDSLVQVAAKENQWKVIFAILQKQFRYKYESLNKVLSEAVKKRNWEIVTLLLKIRKEPLTFDKSLVDLALSEKHEEVSKMLPSKLVDKTGLAGSIVVIAAGGTSEEVAQLLYNERIGYNRNTVEDVLFLSALNGHLEILQLMFTQYSQYKFSFCTLSRAQEAANKHGHTNADRLITKVLGKEADNLATEYQNARK